MMKINFKQPKYIFPLVVFVPLCALVYFVMQTFWGGGDTRQTVATSGKMYLGCLKLIFIMGYRCF